MDKQRFDAFARKIGAEITRRQVLRFGRHAAVAVTLGATTWPETEAKKKKKKKCKKPKVKCGKKCCPAGQVCSGGKCAAAEECDFVKTATEWTLQANCTITKTLSIPPGVTLDGDGKTITMSGTRFRGIERDFSDGNVRNVTLDGSGLTGPCGNFFAEGMFWTISSGEITDVTVRNIPCGPGIQVQGIAGTTVDITNTTVANVSHEDGLPVHGIFLGNVDGIVSDSEVRNAPVGIAVAGEGASYTVQSTTLEANDTGISVEQGGTAVVTGNTFVGPDASASPVNGLVFVSGGSGSAEENTISNYFDTDAGTTSCGILIELSAGTVVIGTNTFPDPPGNENDICDNRP